VLTMTSSIAAGIYWRIGVVYVPVMMASLFSLVVYALVFRRFREVMHSR
jgi:hypothetical protein